jgi:hypothetical protein
MSGKDMPAEPFSPLVESGMATREVFLGFVGAGFTEEQALHLVTAILVESLRSGGVND